MNSPSPTTNVQPGDLAFWKVIDGNWPICSVGQRAPGIFVMRTVGGLTIHLEQDADTLYWICSFREPVMFGWIGREGGAKIFSNCFPIADRFLKKITGPGMVDTIEVYSEHEMNNILNLET